MTNVAIKATFPYRAGTALRTIAGYGALATAHAKAFLGKPSPKEQQINNALTGYPSNHIYRIRHNALIPSLQLYERQWKVTRLWPYTLDSFLDIGCCKGYYTCLAAQKPTCRVAVGVDVDHAFVRTSQQVSDYLGLSNTRFHQTTLDQLADRPSDFDGPFQTVLLIGTYHYLFWGSSTSDHCFKNHTEILSRLAALCTDRVIISGRFELDRLPKSIKTAALQTKEAEQYNTRIFIKAAETFFTVQSKGFLGTYPLFVMLKK